MNHFIPPHNTTLMNGSITVFMPCATYFKNFEDPISTPFIDTPPLTPKYSKPGVYLNNDALLGFKHVQKSRFTTTFLCVFVLRLGSQAVVCEGMFVSVNELINVYSSTRQLDNRYLDNKTGLHKISVRIDSTAAYFKTYAKYCTYW